MLGKIPPLILGPVGIVVVLGLAVVAYMFVLKPKQDDIDDIKQQITQQENKAAEKEKAEAALAKVRREWEAAHDGLAQKMDERSIALSMGQPLIAMINLWREVREDLPPLVEKFVRASGCVIVSGHPGWDAPMDPFPPNTAWINIPIGPAGAGAGTTIGGGQQNPPLIVAGTLEDIERLYKSLRNFPRILTVQHLALLPLRDMMGTPLYDTVREVLDKPEDEIMLAPLVMNIWLMVETPEGVVAAAPAAAPGGPGAPGGPAAPGGPPGGAPGLAPEGAPGGPPGEGPGAAEAGDAGAPPPGE